MLVHAHTHARTHAGKLDGSGLKTDACERPARRERQEADETVSASRASAEDREVVSSKEPLNLNGGKPDGPVRKSEKAECLTRVRIHVEGCPALLAFRTKTVMRWHPGPSEAK